MTHIGLTPGCEPYAEPTRTPRVLLREPAAIGPVDGVWWPWTADLATELHDLISAVTFRTGTVTQVSYAWDELGRLQRSIDNADGVRLCRPSLDQPSGVMYVFGLAARLALLVVPAGAASTDVERIIRRDLT